LLTSKASLWKSFIPWFTRCIFRVRVVLSLSSLAAGSRVHPVGLLSIFSSTILFVGSALQTPSRRAARGSEVRAKRCM